MLVADTDGINVWCSAGKGTFSTDEVVRSVEAARLTEVVSKRRLILPQLAAPGVAADEVRKRTGFYVSYGPVRARDIPAFVAAGFRATDEMRRVSFTMWERAVLVPVELAPPRPRREPSGQARLTGTSDRDSADPASPR